MIRIWEDLVLRLVEEVQASVEVGEGDRDMRRSERRCDLEAGIDEARKRVRVEFLEALEEIGGQVVDGCVSSA